MRDFILKLIVDLSKKKRGLVYVFCLFIAYGIVKSVVYFAPLFLNNILNDVQKFGEFEYSLNLGQAFSTIIALGLPNAYAYFVFKEKEANLGVIFHNIYVAVLLFLVVFGLLVPSLFSNLYFNAVLIGVALSNQIFITTYYKLKGLNFLAIIVDCGIYILLGGFAFLIYKKKIEYNLSTWSFIILGYTIIMVLYFHFRKARAFKSIKKSDWWRVLKYGLLIIVTLCLTSLLTTSTRIYIEYFNNFHSVGIYSLFIRITSVIIIFHRVVVILLYRKIYHDGHHILDNYFALLIGLALFGGFLLYFFAPAVAPYFVSSFENARLHSGRLFIWTILQAVSWTSVAVLEIVIYRENLLSKYIPWLLSILILMGFMFFVYDRCGIISTLKIIKINVCAVLLIAYCQIRIINTRSFLYKKTLISHLILTIICLCFLFF